MTDVPFILASGTNFVPGLALAALMVVTAIPAGVIGGLALRNRPDWLLVGCAYGLLLLPFAIAVLRYPDEGLELALLVATVTAVNPLVALGLTGGVAYKLQRASYRVERYSDVVMHKLGDPAVFRNERERLQRERIPDSRIARFNRAVTLTEIAVTLGNLDRGPAMDAAQLGIAAVDEADADQLLGILFWVTTFGSADERRLVADSWRRRHLTFDQNSQTALGNGLAALILGDAVTAREQLRIAASIERRLTLTAIAHAGVALIENEMPLFERHVIGSLSEYHDDYRKRPMDTSGAMNVFAMAVARLAAARGFVLESRPYLPMAMLPKD